MGWGKPFSKNGWLSKVGKVAAVVAGTALGGPAGGAAAGALVGSLGGKSSGGGLKGALTGGITGGLGGLLAGGLGSAAGSPLAGGIGPTMGSGIRGLLTGGGSNLGSILTGSGSSGLLSGLGSKAGSTLVGGVGPTQGSGAMGLLTRGITGNMNMLGGSGGLSSLANIAGQGVKGASSLNSLTSLLSGGQQYMAQGKEKDELMQGQANAMGAINPYLQSGGAANTALTNKLASGELGGTFNPGDLTKDPGYQFRLQQGEQALGRRQAAAGNYFSGQALQEAQDYGQGIADQTYNEAYDRWLKGQQNTYGMLNDQARTGLASAGVAGDIYTNEGNIRAGATQSRANTISGTLASLLGGGRQQFYDQYGNPVYA